MYNTESSSSQELVLVGFVGPIFAIEDDLAIMIPFLNEFIFCLHPISILKAR